jgi:hypothetical protein
MEEMAANGPKKNGMVTKIGARSGDLKFWFN